MFIYMKLKAILFLLCTTFVMQIAIAQQDSTKTKKKLSFRDPDDGAFDLSQFLLEANGVLPIAIPITEPAVGASTCASGNHK